MNELIIFDVLVSILVGMMLLHQIWYGRQVAKLKRQVDRLTDVLSQASPDIARRIEDGGTKVITDYFAPWADETLPYDVNE